MNETDPAKLWEFYFQPTEVEQAFKELKGDRALRPIYHPLDRRIEAHIFCELWNAIREDDVYLSSNPRSWASALSVVR